MCVLDHGRLDGRIVPRALGGQGRVFAFVRSDNGSEFVARLLAVFLSESGSGSCFIAPGSPWQNGFAESFHSTLRRDHSDAQVKTALYRRHYNEERPHSSLG